MSLFGRLSRARGHAAPTPLAPRIAVEPRFLLTDEQIRDRVGLRQLVDAIKEGLPQPVVRVDGVSRQRPESAARLRFRRGEG